MPQSYERMMKMNNRRARYRLLLLAMLLVMSGVTAVAGERDRIFRNFNVLDGLVDNGAQTMVCTGSGRMVISTIGHINFYDGGTFNHIGPTAEHIFKLPKYKGHYHLYFDNDWRLWLKDKYQVTCVDLIHERFISDVGGMLDAMGFPTQIEDLFIDSHGDIICRAAGCLYHYYIMDKTGKGVMQQFPVRTDAELQDVDVMDGLMLLFYDNSSVDAFDLNKGRRLYTTHALSEAEAPEYSRSSVVMACDHGFYQIRNSDSRGAVLLFLDVATGQWRQVMRQPFSLNNMTMHDGQLYIPCKFGYLVMDPSTGKTEHIRELYRRDGQYIATDINVITFDKQGGMWAGTEQRGIFYAKPLTSPFRAFPWSDPKAMEYGGMLYEKDQADTTTLPRRVNCSFRDSRGWIWQGSAAGLRIFRSEIDPEPLVFRHTNGLRNQAVHVVIEDAAHDVWVGTSNGVTYFDVKKGEIENIINFGEEDDLPTESFVNRLAMKLPDGTIVMQTLDHIVTFNPDSFHTNQIARTKLQPKLIRLAVNGQVIRPDVEYDGKVIIDKAVTHAQVLNLNYKQNSLSMTFSGENFFRPHQTFYRLRMKGVYDEWRIVTVNDSLGWVDQQGLLHLPILGIHPGTYQLELQASMADDYWPEAPRVWTISIDQPWWRTTLVYFILGLIALALMVANLVFFNRITRMKMQRSSAHSTLMQRLRNYVTRCDSMTGETLIQAVQVDSHTDQEQRFIEVMLRIVPYIKTHQGGSLKLEELASQTNVELDELYRLLSDNLHKSPRTLALILRLQDAANMLENTNRSVEEISNELQFLSPNYLISSFYHYYRSTPDDYRQMSRTLNGGR